jgi:hypothetical protein
LGRHDDDAAKVNHAAEMIGAALDATLAEMLPTFIENYGLDDELATLAISKAAANIAVVHAARAAAMDESEFRTLEQQVNETIRKAMSGE